ncbi:MAG: chemotaxis protein CheC [Fimbriimonadaceae bacterium]|nr:chemotaxis protein CheC [Fimbriimonadaceae bacterium]
MELSVVRELTNIGLGHATTSLSEMTGRKFTISVPDVESLSLERIPELLGGCEAYAAGIYMPIEGDVTGHIAFLLPWPSVRSLWKMLLGTEPCDPSEITEMDASALLEIGNIINGSFLSAIADMTNLAMHSTPPYLAIEMSAAILDAIVVEASSKDHLALAIRTTITEAEGSLEGFFVYIPSIGGLRHLFASLGIAEAA